MLISICICTYKRPDLLWNLLDRIHDSRFNLSKIKIEIIIVDNDFEKSSTSTVMHWKKENRHPIHIHFLPQANISAARNMAVSHAKGECIALIDDDEIPEFSWLSDLHNAMTDHNANCVFGPVVPQFSNLAPDWIKHGKFFDRPRFQTGTIITSEDARTGNVLIQRSLLADLKGPFNLTYGLTGGEDSLLFRQLEKNGHVFVWCDEAVVTELVPEDRAKASWLLKRSLRTGQTWIRVELGVTHRSARLGKWMYLLFRSVTQLILSLIFALYYLPFSKIKCFLWLRKLASQTGKISALFGHQYHEYSV